MKRSAIVVLVALGVVACGGGQPSATPSAAPVPAPASQPGALRLGHYSSGD